MFWRKKKEVNYLVVGLGNPGKSYEDTLHNAGFRVAVMIAESCGGEKAKKRDSYLYSEVICGENDVALIRPLTFMNLSGKAVASALRWYGLLPEDVIAVYDDMDLEPGVIRLRARGGTGGHKGVASLIENLGTDQFKRVRVGIGKPSSKNLTKSFVLAEAGDDKERICNAEKMAAEAVATIIKDGMEAAMNKYNVSL